MLNQVKTMAWTSMRGTQKYCFTSEGKWSRCLLCYKVMLGLHQRMGACCQESQPCDSGAKGHSPTPNLEDGKRCQRYNQSPMANNLIYHNSWNLCKPPPTPPPKTGFWELLVGEHTGFWGEWDPREDMEAPSSFPIPCPTSLPPGCSWVTSFQSKPAI